jgi:hypothetical protein
MDTVDLYFGYSVMTPEMLLDLIQYNADYWPCFHCSVMALDELRDRTCYGEMEVEQQMNYRSLISIAFIRLRIPI